ncbi:berberine bridge enzyme-like 17 [Euphorbia lathyris]|uniref:berberine bridge enzyme-like 17 n=1 Tax=Euphorbia lathyris TaxID=212925 RepID=UPI0033137A47
MKMIQPSPLIFQIITILVSISLVTSEPNILNFLKCLPAHTNSTKSPILETVYTPRNSSFESKLLAYIKNRRFLTSKTPKPLAIIAPKCINHVQATVICAKSNGLQIRIRSGGHDYEGLSFISDVPFVILDMFNLREIYVDSRGMSAQVQAGATLGELYYAVATNNTAAAFPGGVCHTVGTGGHFSGGGYGNLMRKYGLSVDNIVDATIVDVNGNILDRKSMGEDLFWAIRGGGGASFGVVVDWRIKLVFVPKKVTVFNISRGLEQGATDVVYRWQQVVTTLDNDLFIRAMLNVVNGSKVGEKKIEVSFVGMFLGQSERLLEIVKKSFPELGLKRRDCKEMSWIESTLFWDEIPQGTPIEVVLERPERASDFVKVKSDYVKNVIPKSGLESIWKWLIEYDLNYMQWNPYGGRMHEISEFDTPFPHRAGNLFLIQYASIWYNEGDTERRTDLLRKMYEAMTPYVSRNPRETFLNYRDNDIGRNPSNFTDFRKARVYGQKYFKHNYWRLAKIKARVDPDNFFKNEQSIPPLFSS